MSAAKKPMEWWRKACIGVAAFGLLMFMVTTAIYATGNGSGLNDWGMAWAFAFMFCGGFGSVSP